MFASFALAEAPVLADMPDVCIADDDGAGYYFSNAFDLDDYVVELPPGKVLADVIWTFEENLTTPGCLEINGVTGMGSIADVCNPAKDVRLTTPGTQSFHLCGPLAAEEEVMYYACTGGAYTTQPIKVSTDCTSDELRGVCDYAWTFEGTTDGWSYLSFSPVAFHVDGWANAPSVTDSGAIGLDDPDDATNYFALWQNWVDTSTPIIPNDTGKAWVALFGVSSTGSTAPSMRFRFFGIHNKLTSYVRMFPGDWIVVPAHGTDSLDVPVVMDPPSTLADESGFALAFDIVDFVGDPRGGQIGTAWLDEVCVRVLDKASLDAGFSTVRSYTATQLGTQWSAMTSPAPGYQLPSLTSDSSGLHITTQVNDTRHFGAWTVNDTERAAYTDGNLARIVYNVQGSSQDLAPDMRLRTNSFRSAITKGFYYASYVEIVPGPGDGRVMPTTATDVPVYFWPPGTVGDSPEIIAAFDGIDIELAPLWGGTIDLNSLDVEEMSGYPITYP
jgi:hypothetical protein